MHPLNIELIEEWGFTPYRLDLPAIKAVPVPDGHPAKPYLGNWSHDAGIFAFELESDRAVLKLNDYDSWRLAGAYEQRLGKVWPLAYSYLSPKAPVDLEFLGLREFVAYQFEPSGKPIRLRRSLRSNLRKISSFASDTVAKFDDNGIVILFHLRVWPARFTRLSDRSSLEHGVYLGLHCEQIKVHEGQRQAWIEQFGEASVWVRDEYDKVQSTRPFPGWNDFVNFLEEIGAPSR